MFGPVFNMTYCWTSSGVRSRSRFPWTTPALLIRTVGCPIYGISDQQGPTNDDSIMSVPRPQFASQQLRLLPILKHRTCSMLCYLLCCFVSVNAKQEFKTPRTVLSDDGIDVQHDDCDITNCEGVGNELADTRGTCGQMKLLSIIRDKIYNGLTSCYNHNLISPVETRWAK